MGTQRWDILLRLQREVTRKEFQEVSLKDELGENPSRVGEKSSCLDMETRKNMALAGRASHLKYSGGRKCYCYCVVFTQVH